MTQYITEDEDTLHTSKLQCKYRATRRGELTNMLLSSGFIDETGFYQPIIVAKKQLCRYPEVIRMAIDFKKEYKEYYLPKDTPCIITVPKMNYIAVRGQGNPNSEDGAYKHSISLLYGVAYTIKMSKKGDHKIDGFYDFVVPPLEGFWWQEGIVGMDYANKEDLQWVSVIRLPDFVSKSDFEWASEEATRKKKTDFSAVEFMEYDEGICVQCMHIGSYDEEPATVARMHAHMESQGYTIDISKDRMHHEIYLSDPRKASPEKRKTVIRHPIKIP